MRSVKEIMTSDPVVCTPETPLPTVARMMCEHDCGEIPIVNSKQLMEPVGVVTDRDIACRAVGQGRNALELHAAEVMTKPAVTVTVDTTIDQCIKTLELHKIRRVPVVDRRGRIVGIVAQADIVRSSNDRKAAEVVREVSVH